MAIKVQFYCQNRYAYRFEETVDFLLSSFKINFFNNYADSSNVRYIYIRFRRYYL